MLSAHAFATTHNANSPAHRSVDGRAMVAASHRRRTTARRSAASAIGHQSVDRFIRLDEGACAMDAPA
jgi:hypothetical protein